MAISGTLGAGFGYHDPTYTTDAVNPAEGSQPEAPAADDSSSLALGLVVLGLLLLMAKG